MQNISQQTSQVHKKKSRLEDIYTTLLSDKIEDRQKKSIITSKSIELSPSDLTTECKNGYNLLENIILTKKLDILKYYFENFDININEKFNKGNSLIHTAVLSGDIEIVKFLIEKGARVEIMNNDGNIPLFYTEDSNIRNLLIAAFNDDTKLNNTIKELNKSIASSEADINLKNYIRDLVMSKKARPDGGVCENGNFISNFRRVIEIENQDKAIEILQIFTNATTNTKTSELMQIASANNKNKIQEYLFKSFSQENEDEKAKILLNLTTNLNIDLVTKFIKNETMERNNYKFEYQYGFYIDNNILQTAISNLIILIINKESNEKIEKGKQMVELLYEHIVGIDPNHTALSSKNDQGVSALKMFEYIENGNFKRDLDRKINEKKYANLTTERFRKLEASSSSPVQEPSCMTALACCCLNSSNSVETNQNGVAAELVFSENDKKTTISPPEIKNQIGEDSEKATLTKKISITASSETSANSIEIRENSPHNSIQNIGEDGAVVRITEITQPTYKTSMEVPDSSQVSSSPSKSNPMPRPIEAQSSVR